VNVETRHFSVRELDTNFGFTPEIHAWRRNPNASQPTFAQNV
jgi:hypothetical protein